MLSGLKEKLSRTQRRSLLSLRRSLPGAIDHPRNEWLEDYYARKLAEHRRAQIDVRIIARERCYRHFAVLEVLEVPERNTRK